MSVGTELKWNLFELFGQMEYDIIIKQQGDPVLTPSGFAWGPWQGVPPLASPRRDAAQKTGECVAGSDIGKVRLNVKLDPVQHAQVVRLSAETGLSISDLVRDGLALKLTNRSPIRKRLTRAADPVLVAQFGKIGSNLNQLARWVNTEKSGADAVQILAELVRIREYMAGLIALPKQVEGD